MKSEDCLWSQVLSTIQTGKNVLKNNKMAFLFSTTGIKFYCKYYLSMMAVLRKKEKNTLFENLLQPKMPE